MSEASRSTLSLAHRYDQALTALAPFFMTDPSTDLKAARAAAKSTLDCHGAATPKELQLATEIVAYGMASIACLGAGGTKNDSIQEMLGWQDIALALNDLYMKNTRALAARQRERAKNPGGMKPEKTRWDEGAFQLAINRTLEVMTAASAKVAAFTATMAPPAPVAAEPMPKLSIVFAEQMTPSVLAWRARH